MFFSSVDFRENSRYCSIALMSSLIDWLNGVLRHFNSISVISWRQLTLFMSSWVSPVLGWGSEVSSPRTLPRKNPEDPVRLEPRSPGLRVKHYHWATQDTWCHRRHLAKIWHFVITPLLLKIFTWNSKYVFTIQRAIHTLKRDNSKCTLFPELYPFRDWEKLWHFVLFLS